MDISTFATGLVRSRLLALLEQEDIKSLGIPDTPEAARELAASDKFEFEKWACGHVGAEGMFHPPGTRGADGGVDGVLKFSPFYLGKVAREHWAVVQVKGGHVTPDAVKALFGTVDHFNADAGVMICFADQMQTVENNRSRRTFTDDTGTYPLIQGLSVEDMIAGSRPNLPNLFTRGAAMKAVQLEIGSDE